ncbi:MAG: hypothetical protein QOE90_1546 [Thermoplasmata archaeon]|jgi:molybdate transport system regulatory protein|nr:hypothetical protein [Thermoplasmata archaeon]
MFGFEARTRALLDAVRRHGNVAAAARSLGVDASNARRHLRTAGNRAGARLVVARRGGRGGRNARLTPAGLRLARAGALVGTAQAYDPEEGVTPVRVGARTLAVAGRLAPGPVELRVPPESVTLERPGARVAATSARNRVPAHVEALQRDGEGTWRVKLRAGSLALEARVVQGSVRDLRLRPGTRVVAVVKAVAVEAFSA